MNQEKEQTSELQETIISMLIGFACLLLVILVIQTAEKYKLPDDANIRVFSRQVIRNHGVNSELQWNGEYICSPPWGSDHRASCYRETTAEVCLWPSYVNTEVMSEEEAEGYINCIHDPLEDYPNGMNGEP